MTSSGTQQGGTTGAVTGADVSVELVVAAAGDGPRGWVPTGQHELAPAGERARVRANLAALRVLLTLDREGRAADDDERRVLARWSGWGAVPAVFDTRITRWDTERAELRGLLGEAGVAAAARSTLNAHYTDLTIVAAVWETVAALGFTGGDVLEPGCGSGNFLHIAPLGVRLTGIEVEPSTARIAAALHPWAEVRAESFADTRLPTASFDLAIGNVPFGAVALHDRRHNRAGRTIADHFIGKSLHLTRPGGLVAVVTSRYTLDAQRSAARRDMAELADLVGAVRLPSGAHERAASTDVVSDLLILRRRPERAPRRGAAWEDTGPVPGHADHEALRVNRYFAEHPTRVLGEFAVGHGAYSAESLRVDPHPGELHDQLATVLRGIVADAHTDGLLLGAGPDQDSTTTPAARRAAVAVAVPSPRRATAPTAPSRASVPAGPAPHEGLLAVDPEGGFTQIVDGRPVAYRVPKVQAGELRALLTLRDLVVGLLDLEASHREDTPAMASRRAELGRRYDAYRARFGPINRARLRRTGRHDPETGEERTTRITPRQGGFRTDPYAPAVYALEHHDPATGTTTTADVLRGRVIAPRTPRTSAASPADALAICLDTHGRVDLPTIARLLDTTADQARDRLGTLVFTDPSFETTDEAAGESTGEQAAGPSLVPAAEYLSGNVRTKLAAARVAAAGDPALTVNVTALEAVVPADLAPGEISAHLGAAWIAADYIEAFMRDVLDDPWARVEHPGGAVWDVTGARHGVSATQTWGTLRRPASELIAAALEQRPVRVTDTVKLAGGGERQVLNVTETLAAQDKARELGERFAAWVWEEPERARDLARVYNDTFNAIVLRSYDDASADTMSLPGLAESFTPRPHQYAAVVRMIAEPAALLAHATGSGKTASLCMGVMELRRLGLVRKPVIVIPNHMLEQWAREFAALYPRARLLIASRDDVTRERRRGFVARCATGDWDAVLMTRSAFERVPMPRDVQRAYLDQEVERFAAWLEHMQAAGAAGSRTVKRIQRMLLAAQERTKAKLDGATDDGLTFQDCGFDWAGIDEAHLYKNLRTPSNVAGAAIDGSQRAQDLDMKLWWLRRQQGRRIVTLATATPIANSITETYVMQRYTRPDLLEAAGIDDFDQWAATFGEVVTTVEMTPDATGFRLTERFARFTNVPELLRMWHVSADIKTAADLDMPGPVLRERDEDGARAPETVLIEPSDELREFVASLGQRAERVRAKQVDPAVDNMLKICTEGRAAALDLRLLGRAQHGDCTVDAAATRIARIWRDHADDTFPTAGTGGDGGEHPTRGALQLVFADLGTPTSVGARDGGLRWDVYRALRGRLVELGMPREQVRFIHDAATDAAKAALFAAARGGQVSVLVGSTEKMGVGTNVQTRAVALHHLDVPWRPADTAQRDGRLVRQGNAYPEVGIYRYVTAGSFDGYSWQILARKSAFIDQVMHGRLDVRAIEDIGDATLSFDEVKALASGDPRVIEKARLDAEVATLERLERAHWRTQSHLDHTITVAARTVARGDAEAVQLDAAIAARRSTRGDDFTAHVHGETYTERAGFTAALAAALHAQPLGATGVTLGGIGGLTLTATTARLLGGVEQRLEFVEAPGDPVKVDAAQLTAASTGLTAALERRLTGLHRRRAQVRADTDHARRELTLARAQLGASFTRAGELADKRVRAGELHQAMTDLARTTPPEEPSEEEQPEGEGPEDEGTET